MECVVPEWVVPEMPADWAQNRRAEEWPWHELTPLPPLLHAGGGGMAAQQTEVRPCHRDGWLYVQFTCHDQDIWGTYSQRDDPIYDEEVVEVFLAPGSATPIEYAELEVSPNGVLLDAWIVNPTGERDDMSADVAWDCPNLEWQAGRDDGQNRWWAIFGIPLRALVGEVEIPRVWRANFYRIERPRLGNEEFSCWAPTLTEPADFHKPSRFGRIVLA